MLKVKVLTHLSTSVVAPKKIGIQYKAERQTVRYRCAYLWQKRVSCTKSPVGNIHTRWFIVRNKWTIHFCCNYKKRLGRISLTLLPTNFIYTFQLVIHETLA
jgi:hypothetical protein